jgi:TatD DNase family protein
MAPEKKLTDTHVHLDQYPSEELGSVLGRAHEAGVRWIVTTGLDLETSASAVQIASAHKQALASVGIHPWLAAEDFPDDFHETIRRLAREEVTVGIGEVGLDFVDNVFSGVTYHDNEALREAQQQAFRQQIELACELGLPLNIHCRGAYSALIPILKEERAHRVGGIVHNFDADEKTASQLLDIGFYLSFGGGITYPTETPQRNLARHIPLDGILIETDSPYMPLHQQRGDRNEPANVAQVAQTLAELRQIEVEELVDITYTNFRNLFDIPYSDISQ